MFYSVISYWDDDDDDDDDVLFITARFFTEV